MPYLSMNSTRLYYEEAGKGQPIIFIHGVWMSSRFFKEQLPYFSRNYHVIIPDLRSHGRSAHVQYGHTVTSYANDLREMMERLGLGESVMVGWSMGSLVVWEYFKQYGERDIKAMVVIDQPACDLTSHDWTMGLCDFDSLCHLMSAVQTDREAAVRDFIPLMFKSRPSPEDERWMFDEMTRIPQSVAGAILFDQTVQDYRTLIPNINVPTLLCFGGDEKLYPVAAGEYLCQSLPDARLVVFHDSGHCPFLEESGRFNRELERFIQSLD
jgi:non-heme chloroperoxidase